MKPKFAFKTPEGKTAVHRFYESLLEHWPTPNDKFFVPTRYGDTFVIASGERRAPPLILLHGSAMNSVMWAGDAPRFAGHFRVYAVDLPGEPGKSDDRQLPFQGPDLALWLSDVFDALAIRKASLAGISLGAWLAAKFAMQYPQKVDKLALLSPAGIGAQKLSFLVTSAVFRLLGDNMKQKLLSRVNGSQAMPEVILQYQRLIDENFNYRREILPLFGDKELKKLTMPVLVFAGENDTMIHSAQTVRRFQRLLPHASAHLVPGGSHALIHLGGEIHAFLTAP